MRALAGVCCAGALFALLGSGTRAQDYNKMMTFTFNDSVQVPGMTLEPGTYMFKLADPESGRRTVQVWNKDGSKMYTMALTTVDRRLDVPDPTKIKDGLVMFGEQPAGTPMAIRTWFYTGDTIGYEFVYPKDQAMAIAKAYHTPVLATGDATSTDAALRGAKVGRIDENGQFTDDATSSVTASTASTADQSATTATQSSTTASTTTASTASSTSTASASTTTAPADSVTSTSTTASTTTADSAAPIPAASTATPSAADSSTTASTTTASTTTAAAEPAPRAVETATVQEPQPVGTTGQATSARATDAAPQTASANTLPQTASPLAAMALFSALSLLSAVAIGQLRRRYSHNA